MSDPTPSIEFGKDLSLHETDIPGLVWLDLPVHGDARGWFKENWQQQKMVDLGLPDFGPRQNNVSFNATRGTTRGIHAEPWDKYVSVSSGSVYGAWVDLRDGPTFGKTFELTLDSSRAIFIPRGVGNSFQALEDGTVYSYLVNDHWVAGGENYAFVNLADSRANIAWPIPLDQAELSDKDRSHPALDDIKPIKPRKILVTGANGQLGRALKKEFPDADFVDRSTFDINDTATWGNRNWRQYQAIINAAAYTKVDLAESPQGRIDSWNANATGVGKLAQLAGGNRLTLVHVSSDYVFDGTHKNHAEEEPFSPLGVYGQSKAAGDIAAATAPRHYIVRTSWVVGDGDNFVNVMHKLAQSSVDPGVVDDQFGRPTFTVDLARGIKHLLSTNAPYGTYNLTNGGDSISWKELAAATFELAGSDPGRVSGVTAEQYFKDKSPVSPRPVQSTLDLGKIESVGFTPRDWRAALEEFLES